MADPMFSDDAEGNPFNEFSAGPDALEPGGMVPDQTLQHQLSAHPEAGGANSLPSWTGDALCSLLVMSDQKQPHEWRPLLEGAVNEEKPSQIFSTPEPPRGFQPSSKILRKREADRRYRAKEKKRKVNDEKIRGRMKRIRAEMVEISEGQKRIRQGQKQVRKKLEEIGNEAAKLKQETNMISKQSAANKLRLDLMFQIVKARAENDSAKDALLTRMLRELMKN